MPDEVSTTAAYCGSVLLPLDPTQYANVGFTEGSSSTCVELDGAYTSSDVNVSRLGSGLASVCASLAPSCGFPADLRWRQRLLHLQSRHRHCRCERDTNRVVHSFEVSHS